MRASMISAALVAAFVGYGSTIALVLAAAQAVGASAAQTASWVLAVCVAKALGTMALSTWSRTPMILAWSTPGAALIAATSGIAMDEAAGAFILAGGLIALTGLIRPLGRLIGLIPDGIAAGMLAGVLLPFVLRLAPAAASDPATVVPMALAFLLLRPVNPSYAVLAGLGVAIALAFATGAAGPVGGAFAVPQPVFIRPAFEPAVLIGLGLPLYLVTMASQNLPGFATLRAAGYSPPVGPALTATGAISALAGLACGHTVNMAAITAAICLGDDVHPDRTRRWQVGLAYGVVWIALGLSGPMVIALLAALPPGLVAAIVGIALLGPVTGALGTALARPEARFAAVVTLAVTASGLVAFGIGAAFWGLVAGLATLALETRGPVVRLASGARLRRAFLLSRRR
ncbi:MAG: benzoate/H(+) symporter BenE family transporter [Rubellimicrobium sp.]|nr:benzoate/H(+) symporter BenE family transporter [Rubellimicrobium sp.]